MHLTNFSVNKKNVNYQKNDTGAEDSSASKWSLTHLKKAMQEQGIDPVPIWKKIEDVCIKSILSAEQKMFQGNQDQVPYRGNCFELLGFDILIDEKLDAWLIEVNLSPSLACDSALDQRIKGTMISDLFTLVGVVPLDRRKMIESSLKQPGTLSLYQKQIVNSSIGSKPVQQTKPAKKKGKKETIEPPPQLQHKAVRDTEEEFKRKCGWRRIFPNGQYSYYKQFFTEERPINNLVDQ